MESNVNRGEAAFLLSACVLWQGSATGSPRKKTQRSQTPSAGKERPQITGAVFFCSALLRRDFLRSLLEYRQGVLLVRQVHAPTAKRCAIGIMQPQVFEGAEQHGVG